LLWTSERLAPGAEDEQVFPPPGVRAAGRAEAALEVAPSRRERTDEDTMDVVGERVLDLLERT
jgi:hypothetical protein